MVPTPSRAATSSQSSSAAGQGDSAEQVPYRNLPQPPWVPVLLYVSPAAAPEPTIHHPPFGIFCYKGPSASLGFCLGIIATAHWPLGPSSGDPGTNPAVPLYQTAANPWKPQQCAPASPHLYCRVQKGLPLLLSRKSGPSQASVWNDSHSCGPVLFLPRNSRRTIPTAICVLRASFLCLVPLPSTATSVWPPTISM